MHNKEQHRGVTDDEDRKLDTLVIHTSYTTQTPVFLPTATTPEVIFGKQLNTQNRPRLFIILTAGVISVYIFHGILQEYLFKSIEGFNYPGYVTLFDFLLFSMIGLGEVKIARRPLQRTVPIMHYNLLALTLLLNVGLGNWSLNYINYPTKVIFRSSKLIPTMIVGYFILRRQYSILEYIVALLMSAGLALFGLAEASVDSDFNIFGIVAVATSVCFEAIQSNLQEKILKKFGVPVVEVVYLGNLFGFVQLLAVLLLAGEAQQAMLFCWGHPWAYIVMFAEAFVGYCGLQFYLLFIKNFGAVLTIFVACCRKIITLLLSWILFPKPFTQMYFWGGLCVMVAIVLNLYVNNTKSFLDAWVFIKYLGFRRVQKSNKFVL